MELPHIGVQCSNKECGQLDFLPIKCDACKSIFCAEHYKYETHGCREAGKRNKTVPVCQTCHELVPAKHMTEEEAMKLHLANNCSPYKRTKIYTNRCNKQECKRKELIPFRCDACSLSFCIKHRHGADHDCRPDDAVRAITTRQRCAAAAERRMAETETRLTETGLAALRLETDQGVAATNPRETPQLVESDTCAAQQRASVKIATPRRNTAEDVLATNGHLSEEEALALAIAQSQAEAKRREEENRKRLVDAAAS